MDDDKYLGEEVRRKLRNDAFERREGLKEKLLRLIGSSNEFDKLVSVLAESGVRPDQLGTFFHSSTSFSRSLEPISSESGEKPATLLGLNGMPVCEFKFDVNDVALHFLTQLKNELRDEARLAMVSTQEHFDNSKFTTYVTVVDAPTGPVEEFHTDGLQLREELVGSALASKWVSDYRNKTEADFWHVPVLRLLEPFIQVGKVDSEEALAWLESLGLQALLIQPVGGRFPPESLQRKRVSLVVDPYLRHRAEGWILLAPGAVKLHVEQPPTRIETIDGGKWNHSLVARASLTVDKSLVFGAGE